MNPTNQAAPNPAAESPKQQATERLRQANNVLVTVSNNPSVDQLAACIGLTLLLNKMNKHATAVYSGQTPSTIGFLKPEETLEKTTDSLRDFIIALDKSKADKLRYKVEDKVVRIFITPYRTSLSEKDLNFSLGDFNVDAVVALGVHQQADLDQAIQAHGRILHDATVISLNTTVNNNLGTINWQDAHISSLSELVATLGNELDKNMFDAQIATALLTGIVAETDRFSNNKTSSQTMSISAQLIAAGANQQLVAAKLEQQPPETPPASGLRPAPPSFKPPAAPSAPPPNNDGTLVIEHDKTAPLLPVKPDDDEPGPRHQVEIDEKGNLKPAIPPQTPDLLATAALPADPLLPPTDAGNSAPNITGGSAFMFEPPSRGGSLSAAADSDASEPESNALGQSLSLLPSEKSDSRSPKNLSDDESVPQPDLKEARHEVEEAVADSPPENLGPIAGLNAQPVFDDLNKPQPNSNAPTTPASGVPPIESDLPPLPKNTPPPEPKLEARPALGITTPPPANPNASAYNGEDTPSGLPLAKPSAADMADAPPPVPPPLTPPVL